MKTLEPTRLYLNELWDYAVRDLNRLRVGDHVLRVHIPCMEYGSRGPAFAHTKTICAIGERTISELYPYLTASPDEVLHTVIEFADKGDHIFVGDAGVIPYPGGFNRANFIVRLEDLVRAGISPIMETRPLEIGSQRVTREQVEAARMVMTLDKIEGNETDPWVARLASVIMNDEEN